MVVRIRLRFAPSSRKVPFTNRHAALVVSSLMTPVALMAGALGFWRIAADLKWTGEFAIVDGIFSRWQVWIALAVGIQFAAFLLHRYGRGDDFSDDDPAVL